MVQANDQMFVYGGFDGVDEQEDVAILLLPMKVWVSPSSRQTVPPARAGHTAVVIDDQMVVFGGTYQAGLVALGDLWAFDLNTFDWTEIPTTGPAPAARYGHTAHWIQSSVWNGGKMVVWGGTDREVNDADIYFLEPQSTGPWIWTVDTAAKSTVTDLVPRVDAVLGPSNTTGEFLVVVGGRKCSTRQCETAAEDFLVYDVANGLWMRKPLKYAASAHSPATFDVAQATCEELGESLPVPDSFDEVLWLYTFSRLSLGLNSEGSVVPVAWVDMVRHNTEWKWQNTTLFIPLPGVTDWAAGEDTDGGNRGGLYLGAAGVDDGFKPAMVSASREDSVSFLCRMDYDMGMLFAHNVFFLDDFAIIFENGHIGVLAMENFDFALLRLDAQAEPGANVPVPGLRDTAVAFSQYLILWGGLDSTEVVYQEDVLALELGLVGGLKPLWKAKLFNDIFSTPQEPSINGAKGVVMNLGDMWVIGGIVPDGNPLAHVTALSSLSMEMSTIPTVNQSWLVITGHTATRVGDKIFVQGGAMITSETAAGHQLDNSSSFFIRSNVTQVLQITRNAQRTATGGVWTFPSFSGDVPPATDSHTAVHLQALDKAKLVVFGGVGPTGSSMFDADLLSQEDHYLDDVYILDIQTSVWTKVDKTGKANWPSRRAYHIAEAWGKQMIVWGGLCCNTMNLNTTDPYAHVFDVLTGEWSTPPQVGKPPGVRVFSASALLGSTLFIYGGEGVQGKLGDLYRLELRTSPMRWTREAVANMPPASGHVMLPIGSRIFTFMQGGLSNILYTGTYTINLNRAVGDDVICQYYDWYPCKDLQFAVDHYSRPSKGLWLNSELANEFSIESDSYNLTSSMSFNGPTTLLSLGIDYFPEGYPATVKVTCRNNDGHACMRADGAGLERGVTLAGIELIGADNGLPAVSVRQSKMTIRGSTIRGHTAAKGAGIYLVEAKLEMIDCSLTDNVALSNGGAIAAEASGIVLKDCTLAGNRVLGDEGKGHGGAVSLVNGDLVATDVRFEDNGVNIDADNKGSHGGAVSATFGDVSLLDCTLLRNEAGVGGGVSVTEGAKLTMTRTRLEGNQAGQGGAIFADVARGVESNDCDYVNNTVFVSALPLQNGEIFRDGVGGGGAIFASGSKSVLIDGGEIVGSVSREGPGGALLLRQCPDSAVTNCQLSHNVALTEGGGGVFWLQQEEPDWTGTTFVDNAAVYGSNVATPATQMRLHSPESTAALEHEAGEIIVPWLEIRLEDFYHSTVSSDHVTAVGVTPAESWQFSGGVVSVVTAGVALFAELRTAVPPNSSSSASFFCNSRNGVRLSTQYVNLITAMCSPGTHAHPGLGVCRPCPPGNFTSSSNVAPICDQCGTNSFSSQPGSANCTPCTAGTWSAAGATACENCDAGTFRSLSNLTCVDCPVGTYAASIGLSECLPCVVGAVSFARGTECRECRPGQYASRDECLRCDANNFTSQSGAVECESCVPGTWSEAGDTGCQSCKAGWFRTESMRQCAQCPQGAFSTQVGSAACQNCSVGSYAVGAGSSTCALCEPGKFAEHNGSTECLPCPPGTFGSGNGLAACTTCEEGKFTLQPAQDACSKCPTDFYTPDATRECLPCQDGLLCEAGTARVQENFWALQAPDGTYHAPVSCPKSGQCQTGGTCGKNRRPPQENPLCGQCLADHVEWGGECVYCKHSSPGVMVLFLLIGFAYVVALHIRSQSTNTGEMKVLLYFVSTARFLAGESIDQFAGFLGFLDFSPEAATGNACVMAIDPYARLGFKTLVPIMFFVILLVTMLAGFVLSKLTPLAFHLSAFTRTLFALLIFSSTVMADIVFRYLNCVEVGPYYVVKSAPALHCNTDGYASWVGFMYVLGILVVAGPLALAVILFWYHHQDKLQDPAFKKFAGTFYECYVPQRYWWEVVGLLRRVVLPLLGVLPYSTSVLRTQVLGTFNMGLLLMHVLFEPFLLSTVNRLETVSLSLLCVITLLQLGQTEGSPQTAIVAILVIVPPVLFILGFGITRLAFVRQRYGWDKAAHLTQRDIGLHIDGMEAGMELVDVPESEDMDTRGSAPAKLGSQSSWAQRNRLQVGEEGSHTSV